jgi:omega-amidase
LHPYKYPLPPGQSQNTEKMVDLISERTDEGVFNSLVVINREGRVAGRYRKTHLITAEPMCEHLYLKSGDRLGTAEIDGVTCGLMTCYDIRFPEVARSLSIGGARML